MWNTHRMAVPWRINKFITDGGGSYCDTCLQAALDISRPQIQQVTSTLETTSDFVRQPGYCDLCSDNKPKVIRRATKPEPKERLRIV